MESSELVEDDYGNLRYIGANPNNYVRFNNELWRIIGVMKDIENTDGTKNDKVKLIRSESIGSYAFNNGNSNDWSTSALQKVLNEGAYWNRTSGECPFYGGSGSNSVCDFNSIGLAENAKNMISDSVWNLGGSSSSSKLTKEFYELERGTTVFGNNLPTWTGKVGLVYPSDYGYATSGGSTTDRGTCLNTSLYDWSESGISDCKNNDWLLYKSAAQWTLTHNYELGDIASNISTWIFDIHFKGNITNYSYSTNLHIYPTIYLNSEVLINNNSDGSSTSPYILK